MNNKPKFIWDTKWLKVEMLEKENARFLSFPFKLGLFNITDFYNIATGIMHQVDRTYSIQST